MAKKSIEIKTGPRIPYLKFIWINNKWGYFMLIILGLLMALIHVEGLISGWAASLLFLAMFVIVLVWSILDHKDYNSGRPA